MKIYFTINAGLFIRGSIRSQLDNSKAKLEYWYPGCRVLLTERKGLCESEFYFEANNLPEKAETHMKSWYSKIKQICNG